MLLKRLWRDQRAFVATTDLILIFTIAVLGTIVGLATLRNSVVQEFGDLGAALGSLNQSYHYSGNDDGTVPADPHDPDQWGSDDFGAWVPGSSYHDQPDFGDGEDPPGQPPAGISVTEGPTPEGDSL